MFLTRDPSNKLPTGGSPLVRRSQPHQPAVLQAQGRLTTAGRQEEDRIKVLSWYKDWNKSIVDFIAVENKTN